jgi:hypothetical protein
MHLVAEGFQGKEREYCAFLTWQIGSEMILLLTFLVQTVAKKAEK